MSDWLLHNYMYTLNMNVHGDVLQPENFIRHESSNKLLFLRIICYFTAPSDLITDGKKLRIALFIARYIYRTESRIKFKSFNFMCVFVSLVAMHIRLNWKIKIYHIM